MNSRGGLWPNGLSRGRLSCSLVCREDDPAGDDRHGATTSSGLARRAQMARSSWWRGGVGLERLPVTPFRRNRGGGAETRVGLYWREGRVCVKGCAAVRRRATEWPDRRTSTAQSGSHDADTSWSFSPWVVAGWHVPFDRDLWLVESSDGSLVLAWSTLSD